MKQALVMALFVFLPVAVYLMVYVPGHPGRASGTSEPVSSGQLNRIPLLKGVEAMFPANYARIYDNPNRWETTALEVLGQAVVENRDPHTKCPPKDRPSDKKKRKHDRRAEKKNKKNAKLIGKKPRTERNSDPEFVPAVLKETCPMRASLANESPGKN